MIRTCTLAAELGLDTLEMVGRLRNPDDLRSPEKCALLEWIAERAHAADLVPVQARY